MERVRDGKPRIEGWWAVYVVSWRTCCFRGRQKKELYDDVEAINGAIPNAGGLRNPMWKFV